MLDRADAGRVAAAMCKNLIGRIVVRVATLLGIDRGDNALAAEFLRRFAQDPMIACCMRTPDASSTGTTLPN